MKRLFTFLAIAAASVLVSCEKETIDGKGNDASPSTSDVFYSVVSQLVNKNELVGDYTGKTFQPTIGIADGGDESVRVVATNSLEAAVNRYNTLTGASIDTNTVSHTFSDKAVGTLTWSKNTDNKAFGTVTASIPSVPTLQKIIYRTGDQGDTNGTFGVNGEATAYYRFGDVIQRTRKDGMTELWVCVRPAFTYEEKEKSHWISVSPLPKENLWEYYDTGKPFTASNGMDYSLPWKIGTDLEWHQDLAEMLFAIMYPEEWATNIQNYSSLSMFGRPSGLPIFNDWHCDNIKYHNKFFWTNVQKVWQKNRIVELLFGISFDEMKALLKQPNANGQGGGPGLYLLYDGSYWSTRFSNKPNLYQVHYFHGTKDTKKNMHEKDTDKPCSQVVVPKNLVEGANNYPLDFYKSMTVQKPYIKEQRFFGDDQPRWVVRYAEGKELTDGVYDPMQVMTEYQATGEVYRYYRDVLIRTNLAEPPEESVLIEDQKYKSGLGYFTPGSIVEDEEGTKWFCYYNWWNPSTEKQTFCKDHYARFVSFQNLQGGYIGNNSYIVNNADLMPESEAPLAAVCLAVFLDEDRTNSNIPEARQKLMELAGINTGQRVITRDTTFVHPKNTSPGSVKFLSLLYKPEGQDLEHNQPYLRLALDQASLKGNRNAYDDPYNSYPHLFFYKHYNCENPNDPNKGRILDMIDLFGHFTFITDMDKKVKSDKWSRIRRHDTNERDGDFGFSDVVRTDMNMTLLNNARYTSHYFEPVLACRFMKVDDPDPSVMPLRSENGHQLKVLYDPKPNNKEEYTMMFYLFATRAEIEAGSFGYSYMDNQVFDMKVLENK